MTCRIEFRCDYFRRVAHSGLMNPFIGYWTGDLFLVDRLRGNFRERSEDDANLAESCQSRGGSLR